ncbi:fibronectin type III domain-containing protein [Metabacillus halosaccharovorans]|uniref:fibronectin type III domain-containing protein n=1 Tax=Metabacillus halosaccharovorans TaxID=930124 RepID=UPI000994CF67|nr:fibronectin type III domain-containing protein [Metabacillus halosaccharovorans]
MTIGIKLFTLHPNAPTNVTAGNATASTIPLNWDVVTFEGGISKYNIYRDGEKVGESATTTFTDSDLTASTTYSYQITAVSDSGIESAKSTAVEGTTTA